VVLLATFGLVVFRDLTEGILVGFGLGALLFLHRMSQAVEVEHAGSAAAQADRADAAEGSAERGPYDPAVATDRDVVVYRISGAFFFGTAAAVSAVLDRLAEHPKAYVIDVSAVPVLDSTAAATVEGFVRKAHRHGAIVFIAGARPPIRRVLLFHGVRPPRVRFRTGLAEAVAAARARARNGADGPTEDSPEAATA
jgi:SulP family sulfate permease